jgi:hypothetical protein
MEVAKISATKVAVENALLIDQDAGVPYGNRAEREQHNVIQGNP